MPRRYSAAQAAQALQRAARLQVEAAEQAEQARGALAEAAAEGYGAGELVHAAQEAGIDGEYVELALAEIDAGQGLARTDESNEVALTRWLGTKRRNLVVSRVVTGEPARVWSLIGDVFESRRFGLSLQKIGEVHPTAGGVALFTMQPLSRFVEEHGTYSQLSYRMEQLELRMLRVRLRDLGDRTQVTIYGDLREGMGVNLKWARRLTVGFAGSAGVAVGVATAGLGALLAVSTGGLAALAGLGSSLGMWRRTFRRALEKTEEELGMMLAALETQQLREEAFGPKPTPPPIKVDPGPFV